MVDPSVLSTLYPFPTSNFFDNIALGSIDSYSRPDSSINFISSSLTQPKPSFEATLPGEPVIKTEDEIMVDFPRTFDGIRVPSMIKRSACGYPFSHIPRYPDFESLDFSALPWVQPT